MSRMTPAVPVLLPTPGNLTLLYRYLLDLFFLFFFLVAYEDL
jgi:hypothetical protein